MEKSRFSSPPSCVLQLKKGGTYELTYTVSIPPSRVLEADFFLRCNTSVLGKNDSSCPEKRRIPLDGLGANPMRTGGQRKACGRRISSKLSAGKI